jgi:outer membrane protein assembly factor BamB/ubiquinone/menaquinone biosynthesis C-methylase UbiE
MRTALIAAALWCVNGATARSADWPTYKGDAARTSSTTETLPANLKLRWTAAHAAPQPAWPVSNRLGFDRAYHPVVAGGLVMYGTSADCRVIARDAVTGAERWSFYTNGPVRFAPAVWKDRIFAASDDGSLYCLKIADGSLLWKKQGGPDDRMMLGNDRMISRWPARGGPVVSDDVVYFGAGIWPSEGIYLYAIEAATGKVLWMNSDSGSIFMAQPHGGANAASGVSAQGYLVVNGDQLLVPTGRAVPAVFDRDTGKFRFFHLQANGHKGGFATMAIGPYFFNAGYTYDARTGKILDPVGAGEVASVEDGLILSTVKDVVAYKWADKTKLEKKIELVKYKGLEKTWSVPGAAGGTAILAAGNAIVCGGEKRVSMVDPTLKKVVWTAEVDGVVHGLALADGRLYVSTDKGTLYAFDGAIQRSSIAHTVAQAEWDTGAGKAASEIMRLGGVTEGHCIDLGCGDGSLAYELAKRTKLHILAIDGDETLVERARVRLQAAGLYGTRVTVFHGDPARAPFPRYIADLVVSGRSLTDALSAEWKREAARVQRPFGGVAITGRVAAMTKNVRGPLEGAGSWTHQYADAANTCCSTDNLVQGPLGMLWFRDSDLESPSRHGRAPAPLFHNGRLFVEGTHGLRAVDAYNGRRLWEVALPNILKPYAGEHLMGTAGTQSNFCVTADGVYVRFGSRCLRLDPATGAKLGEFAATSGPEGKEIPWGYIACEDGILFGTLANTGHIVKYPYGASKMNELFTESVALFALDAKSGKLLWKHSAKESIRHNAIAIGNGKVFLIDRPLASKDLLAGGDKTKEHPKGEMLALDAKSGAELWRNSENIYGTMLAYSKQHDTLLMGYQPTRFKLPSELGGRMAAFQASNGKRRWDADASYLTRPLINGRTVYTQGVSLDLITGEKSAFMPKRSYGCGQLAGSTHMMLFRSATLAYYDLLSPKGVIDYGGIRPGCWINAIPAGGIVMVPDATAGCQCSYLNQAWIALHPLE